MTDQTCILGTRAARVPALCNCNECLSTYPSRTDQQENPMTTTEPTALEALAERLANGVTGANQMREHYVERMTAALADNERAEGLASYLNDIARYEGEAYGYGRLAALVGWHVQQDTTEVEVHAAMFDTMLEVATHTDDTWSGRQNDVRRARHDGETRAVEAVRRWMR